MKLEAYHLVSDADPSRVCVVEYPATNHAPTQKARMVRLLKANTWADEVQIKPAPQPGPEESQP